MKYVSRWFLALMVVAAAFTLITWLCGEVILPGVLKDPVIRWTVATAAAIVVDALVAMWAYSFAKGDEGEHGGAARDRSGKTRNSIKNAVILRSVTQGRDITTLPVTDRPPDVEAASRDDRANESCSGKTRNSITATFIGGHAMQGRDIGPAREAPSGRSVPDRPASREM